MSSKTRYVFDTNVVVSAVLFEGSKPYQAFQSAFNLGEILLSEALVDELTDVFNRRKFDRFVTRDERDEFLMLFIQQASLVEVIDTIEKCRDPKDNKILELAVSGKAQYIITGDKDLLVLSPFREIKIVTVEMFLQGL